MASTTIGEGIRDLLAESTTLQTMLGAGNSTAAKALIHIDIYENPVRPNVLIRTSKRTMTVIDSSGTNVGSGEVAVEIDIDVPLAYASNLEGGILATQVNCEAVVSEVLLKSASGGYLVVRGGSVESIEYPDLAEIAEEGKYYRGNISFDCGVLGNG